MNQDERSWVTSLFAISGVVGTIFYYSIADILGRKFGLCSIAVPHGVSRIIFQVFIGINRYLVRNGTRIICQGTLKNIVAMKN